MSDIRTFDYVIVGAGSAGSILANRLSEDPKVSVLVLEAGGSEKNMFVEMPAAFIKLINDPRFNWCFATQPAQSVNGRAIHFPRGKALGGSSAINGHLYVRGQSRDYDTWAQLGNRGWSYDDVLPYFKRSEYRPGGDADVRGQDGPLHVSDIHEKHPLCEAFIQGAHELGIPFDPDYNKGTQDGVSYYQRTIRNGRRWSAAHAFLRPAMQRPNVTVVTGAVVSEITFDGTRATGLRYRHHGRLMQVTASREVVLSAGTIASPQLLQLSGIGPGELLRDIGVNVRHELAGVGEGFQDHYAVRVAARVKNHLTLNERARGLRLGWEVAKWMTSGKGLLAFSPAHVATFLKSMPHLDTPDLQFIFTPASYAEGQIGALQPFPGMTTGTWQMRPESKGYVRAQSADPHVAPLIQPNYLAAETDQRALVAGIQMCRRFLATDALKPYFDGETLPGVNIRNDDEILDYARSGGATVYHAVSSCRMGSDPMAVVDDQLRVKSLQSLRVIDASVMPTMPSANTNAATMMIAEKGVDLLKATAKL
ncbi:MAG: choline dehydrogenase [Hyphomicrobiaceae bacterium]|jgi:choline dehydrogenase